MSSFTYLSKSALAAAATAATAATGETVDHIRRLSSTTSEEEDPFRDEMKSSVPMFEFMFLAVLVGFFILVALIRCVLGNPNDHPRPASNIQPAPRRILPVMSIEPELNFTNGLTLAGGADHPECTICLSEFVEGEDFRILSNCRHGFHLKCIETWLQSSQTSCPTCRTSCVKNNPPEDQQQQQHNDHVDLEAAANPPEIEMVVLQQHRLNDIDVAEAANLPEPEIVVVLEQQQQPSTE